MSKDILTCTVCKCMWAPYAANPAVCPCCGSPDWKRGEKKKWQFWRKK